MKKTLSSVLSVFTCVVMLFSLFPAGSADGEGGIQLKGQVDGIEFSFPVDWIFCTKDSDLIKNGYHLFGFNSEEQMKSYMETLSLDVLAFSITTRSIVNLTVTESNQQNYSSLSDTELEARAAEFEQVYKLLGFVFLFEGIHPHPQTKFLNISFSNETEETIQFCTICNNKSYVFTLHSDRGKITEKDKNDFTSVIDSVRFAIPTSQIPDTSSGVLTQKTVTESAQDTLPVPEPMYSTRTLDILGDYFVNPGQSTFANHVVIVRNSSNEAREVTVHTWFYNDEGEQVTETDSIIWALDPGCISYVNDMINVQEYNVYEWETVVEDSLSDGTFFPVLEDLSYTCEITGKSALVTVYNNGGRTADYPRGLALFFSGDDLVDMSSTSFCSVNNDLPAGDCVPKKLTAYNAESFDRVEFYLDSYSLEKEPSNDQQYARQPESKTKIVQEYTWHVYKTIYYCAVVENISDQPVKVEASVAACDAGEKKLDLFSDSETIAPGQRTLLTGHFRDLEPGQAASIRAKLYESDANTTPFDSLAIIQTPVSHGVVFTVTNNGDQTFDWLNDYVLFVKNGEVVKGIWQRFAGNSDPPLAPGDTASALVDAESDFDEVFFSFKE